MILLTNAEHLNPGAIHSHDPSSCCSRTEEAGGRTCRRCTGPSPKEAALDFLHQMQAGKLDRDKLGEEFGLFLTDERVKAAARG